jgi:hypothetical protein
MGAVGSDNFVALQNRIHDMLFAERIEQEKEAAL